MGSTRARIAIDAMGGDHAPREIVLGAIQAQKELDVDVLLVGNPQRIEASIPSDVSTSGLTIVEAEDAVGMDEEAVGALRRKPKASINVAMDLVKQDKADAVISAGHSGAVMAAALLRLGRIPGVDRPAIGILLPTVIPNQQVLILDVGANVDCRPQFLDQFAVMGSAYSRIVMGIAQPKVGLINIGEEDCKGNDLALRTYQLLKHNDRIHFVGNAEGRDVLSGNFDVIVCDGFVGNVLLKFAEAIGEAFLGVFREELPKGIHGKIGSALVKPNLKKVRRRIDHAEHGGGLLLGVAGVCLISHGSSKADSICNAVRAAKEAVDRKVLDQMQFPREAAQQAAAEATATADPDAAAQPPAPPSPDAASAAEVAPS
ncbi:MAG: phosphate acyltransferase PlsX [Prochlorothrix sp.]|nr:phosphate acyltransferase PlsX [Prochlorothrix sp.]